MTCHFINLLCTNSNFHAFETSFSLQVETLDEDIRFMEDILQISSTHNLLNSSTHTHDGLPAASSEPVLTGDSKILMQTESERDGPERFIQKNKSTYKKTVEQYYEMLTATERDLIYTAYYHDYLLFGYDPCM